ncbi:hypothetical protein [Variovorax sp. RA8]|uniref:hypothetical protein n=1 Tax=Variovorax sp. (strain JCM 16519 / RA8) TaxID=662548 RepID=UPI00131954AA|nr:hypothetical protein [Variovorax sp. RA8]VTU44910.1 hypothetical protein RA8P2_00346 [Variovorax sp. RA8]
MKTFIATVALSPWIAYHLLGLLAGEDAAWQFVSSSLWVGTPILVVVAALRAYGEGLQRGERRAKGYDDESHPDRPAFQTTQLGQLN